MDGIIIGFAASTTDKDTSELLALVYWEDGTEVWQRETELKALVGKARIQSYEMPPIMKDSFPDGNSLGLAE